MVEGHIVGNRSFAHPWLHVCSVPRFYDLQLNIKSEKGVDPGKSPPAEREGVLFLVAPAAGSSLAPGHDLLSIEDGVVCSFRAIFRESRRGNENRSEWPRFLLKEKWQFGDLEV